MHKESSNSQEKLNGPVELLIKMRSQGQDELNESIEVDN